MRQPSWTGATTTTIRRAITRIGWVTSSMIGTRCAVLECAAFSFASSCLALPNG